jgi:hypothetical protein
MQSKRKKSPTEWVRISEAAEREGVARTTLTNRIARREYRTKIVGGVCFVRVEKRSAAPVKDAAA